MKTVEDVLRETGLTDEQIAALDPKIKTGVTTLVTSANQTLEQAELAKRALAQQYDQEIAPALDRWANEKAEYDTKMAAYEAALKAAKEGGFQVPAILTPPTPPVPPSGRDASGKFVAGANQVPGSPQFVADLRKEAGAAIGSMLDLTWKYQTLYGKPMPDSPTVLIAEANAQRMDPITYAAKKYDFAGKEASIKAEETKKREDAIRTEVETKLRKEFAEQTGSNPMVRRAEVSRFSELAQAVSKNERPDPLKMNKEQRHANTRQQFLKEAAATESVQ